MQPPGVGFCKEGRQDGSQDSSQTSVFLPIPKPNSAESLAFGNNDGQLGKHGGTVNCRKYSISQYRSLNLPEQQLDNSLEARGVWRRDGGENSSQG